MPTSAAPIEHFSRSRGVIGRADLLRAQVNGLVVRQLLAGDQRYLLEPIAPLSVETQQFGQPQLVQTMPETAAFETAPRPQLQRLLLLAERKLREPAPEIMADPEEAEHEADCAITPDPDAFSGWLGELDVAGAPAIARRLARILEDRFAAKEPGSLDLAALSERVARRRSLAPLPRRNRAGLPAVQIVIDISRSMAPLWAAMRQLAQCLRSELQVLRIVELRERTNFPAVPPGSTALLLSDLRSVAAREWLLQAQMQGISVLCVAPAALNNGPKNFRHHALGAVDPLRLGQMLAAVAAVPYWNASALLGGTQLLSREGDAWALTWALWNHPSVCSDYSRIWVEKPPLDSPCAPTDILLRYLAMHAFEPEADRATAEAYLRSHLSPKDAPSLARYRKLCLALLAELRNGCTDGLNACLAVRLVQVAPQSERDKAPAMYSELFQRAHQQLGICSDEGLALPEGLQPMPRVKQNDTDTWRLVQVDDALWLMPKAPHSPLLTHCIADSIALNKGDWIALRSGDKSQVHSVASNSLQLVSSFGELASIVLLTPAEHFTVLSVWRPSWVVGWGRKPEGAYALANSIRGEAHDFRLIENSGFVSDLLLASDRVELETLLAERREWEGKFGSFLLLKLLNRNPLDEVWLAERFAGATRQRVALKLLRESIKRDGEQLFNHQRAVTSLEHPCIARVIDTGDEKGVTWIAVEHVQGEAITGWCDYHSVSVKKRVQMFLHVLDAVRVGHTHLVVHSDLRSPNILVDNHGMPKLLNFGYGKQLLAANKVSFFSFCPPSPEQFSGENTVATDIYQLGALLYELLSGSVPFSYHGASPDLIRELVLHRMPAIPSIAGTEQAARVRGLKTGKQLGLVLKGDLDRIVLRALHKNPSERYRTTLDFSHELIAWLNQRSEKW